MSNAGRKPIEVTETMLSECERLASLGFNEKQISEAINMTYSVFQNKKDYFRDALKKGRQQLRERITSSLLAKIDEQDVTSLIFVSKRLGLFTNSFDASTPSDVKEAMAEMLKIYVSLADGTISETQADKLMGTLQSYIKAYEVSELETRLKALEEKAL